MWLESPKSVAIARVSKCDKIFLFKQVLKVLQLYDSILSLSLSDFLFFLFFLLFSLISFLFFLSLPFASFASLFSFHFQAVDLLSFFLLAASNSSSCFAKTCRGQAKYRKPIICFAILAKVQSCLSSKYAAIIVGLRLAPATQ